MTVPLRRRFVGLVSLLLVGAGGAVVAVPATSFGQPTDTEVYSDGFEQGLAGWTVTTGVNGRASTEQRSVTYNRRTTTTNVARLTVPDYGSGSIAYMKRSITPTYGLSAVGLFNVTSGGCDSSAGYSAGSVPLFRFFDTNGKRVAGLYRINGACNTNTKLYVQHSGSYFRTGKNIALNEWNKMELRAAVQQPGQSLVQVFVNDVKVYETLIANNGHLAFASVNVHNEHTNQVGDLLADDLRLATFDAGPVPTNPCTPGLDAPTTPDPGTTLVADDFESYTLSKWSLNDLAGDATAIVEGGAARSGTCAARLRVTSNAGSRANLSKDLPSGSAGVLVDGWFKVKSMEFANTSSNVPLVRLFSDTSRLVDVYRSNSNGMMYLRLPNGSGGFTYTSLGRIMAFDTWHHVRVRANVSSGTVEVSVGGTTVYSGSGLTLGSPSFSSAMIGSEHFAQQMDLSVDDVVIKDVQ